MPDLFKNLLALGITIGLSDREAFINKAATLIKEYQDDREKAEKLAKAFITYLEELKDDIRMQQVIKNSVGGQFPQKQEIDKLTEAIKELTKELQGRKSI